MLRSDGVSVQLGSTGTDALGRTGMTGIVDKHWVEKFGSAILLSLVGGAAQFIANLGQDNQSGQNQYSTIDPATGQPVLVQGQPNQNALYAPDRRSAGLDDAEPDCRRGAARLHRHSTDDPCRSGLTHHGLRPARSRFLGLLSGSGEGAAGNPSRARSCASCEINLIIGICSIIHLIMQIATRDR